MLWHRKGSSKTMNNKPQDPTGWMNAASSSPPTLGYYSSAGPRVQGTKLCRWKAPSRSLLWSKSWRRSLDLLQGSSSERWSPHWGALGWTTSAPLQSKKKKHEHVIWELDEWQGLRNKDVRNVQASGNVTKLHKKFDSDEAEMLWSNVMKRDCLKSPECSKWTGSYFSHEILSYSLSPV